MGIDYSDYSSSFQGWHKKRGLSGLGGNDFFTQSQVDLLEMKSSIKNCIFFKKKIKINKQRNFKIKNFPSTVNVSDHFADVLSQKRLLIFPITAIQKRISIKAPTRKAVKRLLQKIICLMSSHRCLKMSVKMLYSCRNIFSNHSALVRRSKLNSALIHL